MVSIKGDLEERIAAAVDADDDTDLLLVAEHLAEFDEERAEQVRGLAMRARRNQWAYDETRDNSLTA